MNAPVYGKHYGEKYISLRHSIHKLHPFFKRLNFIFSMLAVQINLFAVATF